MSEYAVRGVGIDFGAGECRVVAVEGAKFQVLCEGFAVPMQPLSTQQPNHVSPPADAETRQPAATPYFQLDSIKRHLGRARPIVFKGEKLANDEAAVRVFKALKQESESRLGATITGVAVTVPPCFTDRQYAAAKACAEAAGFSDVVLIDDSRAAGLAYSKETERRGKWVVYGLGKSVFFVTVLDTTTDIRPLAHNGNIQLGGDDFDALMLDDLIGRGSYGKFSHHDVRRASYLLQGVTQCKVRLSSQEQTELRLRIPEAQSEGSPVIINFSRARFEKLIAEKIDETMRLTTQTLQEAGLRVEDIDRVLLVGRSTRIPLVKHKLSQLLFKETEHLPDDFLARGAALYSTRIGICFSPHTKATEPQPAPPASSAPVPSPATPAASLDLPKAMFEPWKKVQQALQSGELQQAIIAYEEFLGAAQEDLSYIYNQLAAQLDGQGKRFEAVQILEQGFYRYPGNPIIAAKLSDLYVDLAIAKFQLAQHTAGRRTPYFDDIEGWKLLHQSLRLNKNNQRAAQLKNELEEIRIKHKRRPKR